MNGARTQRLTSVERELLDVYQRGLPLSSRPFADIGRRLGVSEQTVLRALRRLQASGVISRVGPVFAAGRVGASTLAALAVPAERLEEVAEIVSAMPEVNHNYQREHHFNLWFVITAESRTRVEAVLRRVARRTGLEPMDLPMERDYHIDLGFALWR